MFGLEDETRSVLKLAAGEQTLDGFFANFTLDDLTGSQQFDDSELSVNSQNRVTSVLDQF